jgi:hypothetical protein
VAIMELEVMGQFTRDAVVAGDGAATTLADSVPVPASQGSGMPSRWHSGGRIKSIALQQAGHSVSCVANGVWKLRQTGGVMMSMRRLRLAPASACRLELLGDVIQWRQRSAE